MLFTTPTPPEDALNFANKVLVGSPLTSSEWGDVPVELRMRAFFSSEVESVQFLQRARDAVNDFLANNRDPVTGALKAGSRAAFVDQMQTFLESNGIVRTDGGLTDIASQTRLGLIFNTQVQQANSFAYWKSGLNPAVLNEFPAMRFIRMKAVKEPRQTHSIYQGQVFLKTNPIWWRVINQDFGVPWGPWGWGCGHDVEDVDRAEAEKLGLIKSGERLDAGPLLKKFGNFNSGLQASIKNLDPDLLEKLKLIFGNRIKIVGDTIQWSETASAPAAAAEIIPEVVSNSSDRVSPVSASVIIKTTRPAAATVRQVLSLIDQVHDDGELEPLVLNHHVSGGAQGVFYRAMNMIGIRRTGVVAREMTIAHEIGHWIDFAALPGNSYSSQFSPALEEWRQAVMNSAAIKKLQTEAAYRSNPDYHEYVLRVREIWARAYTQYIALRSGNATLLQQIQNVLDGKTGYWIDSQWTEEDFKPIAAAIDKLFKQLNWL